MTPASHFSPSYLPPAQPIKPRPSPLPLTSPFLPPSPSTHQQVRGLNLTMANVATPHVTPQHPRGQLSAATFDLSMHEGRIDVHSSNMSFVGYGLVSRV